MGTFTDLPINDKIQYTKREFSNIIKNVFENPEVLKTFIGDKKISNEQSKSVLKLVNALNSKTCACCRRFDPTKLQMSPVDKDLEPILDIAKDNVKTRSY